MKKLQIREKLEQMIGTTVTIYIDRPIGSVHPKYQNIIYPINYGYIKELTASDNEYQDAYLLGVKESVKEFKGIIYAVIERDDDNEDKLIVVPNGKEYSLKEIRKLVEFQEKYFKSKIYK